MTLRSGIQGHSLVLEGLRLTPCDRDAAAMLDRVPARMPGFLCVLNSSVPMSVPVVLKRSVVYGKECRELPETLARLCHALTVATLSQYAVYFNCGVRLLNLPLASCFDTCRETTPRLFPS